MMKTKWWAGLALFLYVWLMVGFATGTATLLGPARWITAGLRGSAWSAHENHVMILVILCYISLSFLLARMLTSLVRRTSSLRVRVGVPGVATVAAGLALWGWLNPATYAMAAGGMSSQLRLAQGPEFDFGPYPDKSRLLELKREGVTAVVSLQHPAVVPFEPAGIAGEQQAAREVGIEFIHAPMLPWVASNQESLEKIKELARSGHGHYYVHCGLGRDRTNVVKRMLEGMGAGVTSDRTSAPRDYRRRMAERGPRMERGDFRELDKDVWLVPYPNEHELYGNMLAGQVKHVLVLLDEGYPEQAAWASHLRKVFSDYRVPATFETLAPGQLARTADLAAFARVRLPRPLAVIVPSTPPLPHTEVADAFAREWGGLRQAAR
jgi:hypothetical protein